MRTELGPIFRILAACIGVFAAMALTGCEKEGSDISKRTVKPVVSGFSMTKAGGEQDLDYLKANGFLMDIFVTDSYEDMGVMKEPGQYGSRRSASWTGSAWALNEDAFWVNNTPMKFWAYNDAALSAANVTGPTYSASSISFSYPKGGHTPDGQTDLLFAYQEKTHSSAEHTLGGANDQIDLTFKHALSKITFAPEIINMPAGYSLKQITITGLKTSGDCSFNGSEGTFTWTNQGTSQAFTATSLDSYFLVVPQNAQTATISFTLEKSGSEDKSYGPMNLADHVMEAGKQYGYRLNIGDYMDINLDLAVLDWDEDYRSIEILGENTIGQYLTYDRTNLLANDVTVDSQVEHQLIIQNRGAVTGSFKLNHPVGAKLLLALDGNLDAFKLSINGEDKNTVINEAGNDGNGKVINFSITPKNDVNTNLFYSTQLHIYLVNADATVRCLDDDLMKEGSPAAVKKYTIVLPKQN